MANRISAEDQVRAGLTYGDARRHILLEFSFQQYPVHPEDLIIRLRLGGITPVIAHPERIRYFQEDVDRLERLVRSGALAQVTSSSLVGTFGSRVRELTESMLRRRIVHLLASDAPDLSYRPPGLDRARQRAAEILGEDAACAMPEENPAALLEGREIPPDDPVDDEEARRPRRRFFGLFGRTAAIFYGYPVELIELWCGVSRHTAYLYKIGARKPSRQALKLFVLHRDGRVLGPEWREWNVAAPTDTTNDRFWPIAALQLPVCTLLMGPQATDPYAEFAAQ